MHFQCKKVNKIQKNKNEKKLRKVLKNLVDYGTVIEQYELGVDG